MRIPYDPYFVPTALRAARMVCPAAPLGGFTAHRLVFASSFQVECYVCRKINRAKYSGTSKSIDKTIFVEPPY